MKHMRTWAGLLLAMAMLFLSACGDAAESSSADAQDGETGASALLQFELPEEGDEIVVINTSMGTLKVMLFPEIAPKAVENFVAHAKEGYYNGLKFYKIQKDKCLYTGDPKGDGTGGESVFKDEDGRVQPFEDEYSMDLWHFNGALSMVNDGAEVLFCAVFQRQRGYAVADEKYWFPQQCHPEICWCRRRPLAGY